MVDKKQKETIPRVIFSKEKILGMKRYAHRVDVLGVLLKDDRQYTFKEVDDLLAKFMKGKVK